MDVFSTNDCDAVAYHALVFRFSLFAGMSILFVSPSLVTIWIVHLLLPSGFIDSKELISFDFVDFSIDEKVWLIYPFLPPIFVIELNTWLILAFNSVIFAELIYMYLPV